MRRHYGWLLFILLLSGFALWVALPDEFCYQETLPNGQVRNVNGRCIRTDIDNNGLPEINFRAWQSQGLDLVGGLRVLLQAESPVGSYSIDELQETANNVSRRVNALGLTEATVQVQGGSRILVELPGATDCAQAVGVIQRTALLEFVDFGGVNAQPFVRQYILTTEQVAIQQAAVQAEATAEATSDATAEATIEATADATAESTVTPAATAEVTAEATAEATAESTAESTPEATAETTPEATAEPVAAATSTSDGGCDTGTTTDSNIARAVNPATGQPFTTIMTGAGLQSASAQFDASQGWYIEFELTPEGGAIFGPFTESRINQPLAIVLDGQVLSAPTIQARLDTGGIIRGSFTEEEARELALQLRSGALPIPLRVESAETVGATLGQEAVRLSIRAGIIGIIVVFLFMLVYYRVPGIAAALALVVFILLNLAVYKLIPVTLTLPAITGFLISVGTAVDGNILIFERMKEELRGGKDLDKAVQAGFDRAWNSIRDSNFSTILICSVLFLFGQTPGASIVSGFAVTLALGLLLNLFTAVIVTRTFLRLIVDATRSSLQKNARLLGV